MAAVLSHERNMDYESVSEMRGWGMDDLRALAAREQCAVEAEHRKDRSVVIRDKDDHRRLWTWDDQAEDWQPIGVASKVL